MSQSYQDIKAYIKQINTAKGRQELQDSEIPPAWIFCSSKVPRPAEKILFSCHSHVSQTNSQNRKPTLTHQTDACLSEKISLSSELSGGASDATSQAYVLFEQKSETFEPALITSSPIPPSHKLAISPRAEVEAGYESDTHVIPQSFGAGITFDERTKKTLIYRPTNRCKMSPLLDSTSKLYRSSNRVSFLRKNRGKRAVLALRDASILLIKDPPKLDNN